MLFERLSPLTGEVASSATAMTAADIPAIAARAAAAFPAWAAQGPNARRAVLMKAADALMAKKDAFVAAMIAETGATAGWAMFNLDLAASVVREAAAITTQITGEVIPSDKPGCIALALKEPVGVILGIAPWNGPIVLGVRAIAVPLACGNTVILKASETCPQTHALIIEAFAEAGFPDGVVNLVTNAPADAAEVVGALIDAPEVKRINFTGSTAVGRIVARRAAEHLKPCLLELGGKAPVIVFDDADLDSAVEGLVDAIWTSVKTSVIGIAILIPLGFFMAFALLQSTRIAKPVRMAIDLFATLPIAVPASLMGFGLLFVYSQPPIQIYGTTAVLVVTYVTLMVGHSTRLQFTTLVATGQEFLEASRACGAGPLRSLFLVLLPMCRKGIAATAALTFVLLFHEFSASLMVRSARTQVIGSVMYDVWAGGVYSQVAVLALIMVVVTVIGVCIAGWMGGTDSAQQKG